MGCCQSSTTKQFENMRDLYQARAQGDQNADRKLHVFERTVGGDKGLSVLDKQQINELLQADGLTEAKVKQAKAIAKQRRFNLDGLMPSPKDVSTKRRA